MLTRLTVLAAVFCLATTAHGQEAAESPSADLERRLDEQQAELRRMAAELERLQEEHTSEPDGSLPVDEAQDMPPPVESDQDQGVELGLFYIRSSDHAHELSLHARVMLDGLFDLARDYFDNTFQVRRARLTVGGHVFKYFGYKLGLEFGRTVSASLRDGYVKFAPVDEVQLWAGQMLLPYSTSRLRSSNYLKHPERPIMVSVVSGRRDVGAQLYGQLFGRRVTYWFGIHNGTTQNVRQDSDDDFDLATRVEVRPLSWLQLSANYIFTPTNRDAIGPLDVRTVGNEASRFLDYDTLNLRRRGKRHRLGGGVLFHWGPLELKGEVNADYLRRLTPAAGGVEANLLTYSYFVDASVVLTGEENQEIIRPESPFYSPTGFGSGAFELALRFEDYRADPDSTRLGFATGTDKVKSGTATLTWIPVEGVRCMVSYTASAFSDQVVDAHGAAHHSDHVLLLRFHLFF